MNALGRSDAERGAVAIELALGILVILVPVALLVLSFGPTLERRTFVRLAAAEVARFVVLSDGDEASAIERLGQMAANNRIAPSEVTVSLCGGEATSLDVPAMSSCLVDGLLPRDGVVVVRVDAEIPILPIPEGVRPIVRTAYEHSEFADPYRSIP